MLQITIVLVEGFDEAAGEFAPSQSLKLDLEHSLVSLSKWESKWELPFLSEEKSQEQAFDYVRMMILGPIPSEEDFSHLSEENLAEINTYINAKMTATWFSERHTPRGRQEIVTAELIYYWMISLGVPFECQHWHLNRLLTLIKVCSIKNAPKKKMSRSEAAAQQRELNATRRRQTGSTG